MTYVATVLAVALVLVALIFAGLVRSLVRAHARERDLLLNQLMHLAGRTWQPPPAVQPDRELEEFDDRFVDPAQRPEL